MEKVVQRTLCKESQKIDKEAVIKCIVEDTDVASRWRSLGVDGESGIALRFLDIIIFDVFPQQFPLTGPFAKRIYNPECLGSLAEFLYIRVLMCSTSLSLAAKEVFKWIL